MKIISILPHPPAYDLYKNEPRPRINWDTPAGDWVGIWGYDWADQIGNEILKRTDKFKYEVWQPDLRADKIYSHTFESGLKHKLFPAEKKIVFNGYKFISEIYSKNIIKYISKEKLNEKILLQISLTSSKLNNRILKYFSNKIPIISQNLGNTKLLIYNSKNSFIKTVLKKIEYNIGLRRHLKLTKYIILSNIEGIDKLMELTNARIFIDDYYPVGIDYNFWKQEITKDEARRMLGIPNNIFVIFSSSRLNSLKQIDKFIIALSKINNKKFLCYISGHGNEGYEKYLNNLITKLNMKNNVFLIGYVDVPILKNYYQSCDLFISTSIMEGGPTSPIIALLMNKPVLITETGKTYEFMKRYKDIQFLPVNNYSQWSKIIESYINKRNQNKIPIKDVINFINWDNVTKFYINTFEEILC